MIVSVTMISIFLMFILALYATNRTGAKPNGTLLIGVTLPYDALKNKDVAEIVRRYKKASWLGNVT